MHSTDDLNDSYLGSGLRLRRSIEKYGVDHHRREILEELTTRTALSDREAELITPELRADPLCMNCGPGGLGAVDRPATKDETRKKLSEASRRVKHTPEWHAKIGAKLKGKPKPRSAEGDAAWRAANVGRKQSETEIQARIVGQLSSEKFKRRYRPIIVDGITYQNGREAVVALGIPGGTLANRLGSPNWLNYSLRKIHRQPRHGLVERTHEGLK